MRSTASLINFYAPQNISAVPLGKVTLAPFCTCPKTPLSLKILRGTSFWLHVHRNVSTDVIGSFPQTSLPTEGAAEPSSREGKPEKKNNKFLWSVTFATIEPRCNKIAAATKSASFYLIFVINTHSNTDENEKSSAYVGELSAIVTPCVGTARHGPSEGGILGH